MIVVTDWFKSVRVTSEDGPDAGERVVIEFAWRAPSLDRGSTVRVSYPLSVTGSSREIQGTPDYMHTTALPGGGWLHHYRLSHWAPTEAAESSA
jgi:hypothetical protein